MEDLLFLAEKKKYDEIWGNFPDYRSLSAAEKFTPFYLKTFRRRLKPGQTLIDFGCGTGRAAKSFLSAGLRVELVDFSSKCLDDEINLLLLLMADRCRFWESCLWDLPQDLPIGEWGLCCDVMEHIPPEKIDSVLASIAKLVTKGALFTIFLEEDLFGAEIKQPLHLAIQPKQWWQKALKRYFSNVRAVMETNNWVAFTCLAKS